MKLQPSTMHPHGLTDADYNALFTKDKPIIFAFHGYPTLIHELTYCRENRNIHVFGYKEEGTITTPFDMRVQNEIDRFSLVKNAIQNLPQLGNRGSYLIQKMNDKLAVSYTHLDVYKRQALLPAPPHCGTVPQIPPVVFRSFFCP